MTVVIGYFDAATDPSVASVDILHTWGPTVVMAVGLAEGDEVVFKASGRQDVGAEVAAWALREGVDWVPSLLAKAERLLVRID
ncbi:MAG: hypothetical protein ACRD0P_03685 [Stackebrandtia sp.]